MRCSSESKSERTSARAGEGEIAKDKESGGKGCVSHMCAYTKCFKICTERLGIKIQPVRRVLICQDRLFSCLSAYI